MLFALIRWSSAETLALLVAAGAGDPLAALPLEEPSRSFGGCEAALSEPPALNPLDGRAYPHHPLLLKTPRRGYAVDPNYLVELHGLRVPRSLDCEGNASADFNYHFVIPSRWHACHIHAAHIESGLFVQVPELPLIDEEYGEWVAVYEAVFNAKGGTFVMAELGSRWGTWGARAAALLRVQPGAPAHDLYFVEATPRYCLDLADVMSSNGFKYTLTCDYANAPAFLRWSAAFHSIDLVHIDIQGHELVLLTDPDMKRELDRKVGRLIIGTHSTDIHLYLLYAYGGWVVTEDTRPQTHLDCITKYLHGLPLPPRPQATIPDNERHPDRSSWRNILRWGCYLNTSRGPVAHWDGTLVLDNPRAAGGE